MSGSVHALVLAAGRSSRTGAFHKLLSRFDGVPLIRRSVAVALASKVAGVTVVLGYRCDEMRCALNGVPAHLVENPRWTDGLSSSLQTGFAAVSRDADGILVMLADQPLLEAAHLDRLIDAFAPSGEGSLVAATDNGKRFNPVVISSIYEIEIAALSGDVGAREILSRHLDLLRGVEIGRAASCDVDTVETIAAAGGVPSG